MTRLTDQLETPLPIDEAFAFVADFANAMHWDPGVATSARLDAGPLRVGTRFRLGVRLGSRVAPMDYRIATLEAPRAVVLEGEGSGVRATDEIRFAPIACGTRIDYTADIRLQGWRRLVQPFLGRVFDRIARDAIGGMKATLDRMATKRTA